MYIRNIRERAHTALPFLSFDADPYMVIDGGGRCAGSSMPTPRRLAIRTRSRSATA